MNARRTTACVSTSRPAIVSASAREEPVVAPPAEPREQSDPLLEPEDLLALLLGDDRAEDLPEQPDVRPKRRVGGAARVGLTAPLCRLRVAWTVPAAIATARQTASPLGPECGSAAKSASATPRSSGAGAGRALATSYLARPATAALTGRPSAARVGARWRVGAMGPAFVAQPAELAQRLPGFHYAEPRARPFAPRDGCSSGLEDYAR